MLSNFAPAKVNLYLHVTGKRPDGYHLLDSLAVFPAVGDQIFYAPDNGLSLAISGRFGAKLDAEADNLVLRAARMLAAKAGITAAGRLHLEKNLPVASGIGGGSADAAAALRILARHWNLDFPLDEIALALGADVPVCLASRPARMAGIGETLHVAPSLPRFGILLVNPGIAVATAAVFRARDQVFSPAARLSDKWADAAEMAVTLGELRNDLEAPAIALAPGIGEVLAVLRSLNGALLVRMSGSGATCFAIFATPEAAAEVAQSLDQPGWWCWGGGLYEPGLADL